MKGNGGETQGAGAKPTEVGGENQGAGAKPIEVGGEPQGAGAKPIEVRGEAGGNDTKHELYISHQHGEGDSDTFEVDIIS